MLDGRIGVADLHLRFDILGVTTIHTFELDGWIHLITPLVQNHEVQERDT